MSTNNKHKICDKELDNLLGQAFLNLDFNNPKNQKLMETISNQVLPTEPVNNININKTLFTKLISVIAIIATSVFIYFHYFKTNQTNQTANSIQLKNTISTTEQPLQQPKQKSTLIITTTDSDEQKIISKENKSIIVQPETKIILANTTPKYQSSYTIPYIEDNQNKKQEDTNYVFPKLTDKEIKETIKQKEKMINWLFKQSKDKYSLITPKAAHSIMSNINDTLAMFYMQNAEVTNLEYRTFLFDLLMSDNKPQFLIAKPNQKLWVNAPGKVNGKMMQDLYFSDKKYNDYPVVNISPKGAELYCEWLSSLSKKGHSKIAARLPYENEWIYAAKRKDSTAIYPWSGDSIQNKYGCFLANFCIKKQNEKLRPNIKCTPKNKNAYTSAEFMLGDSMMTSKVYSYNPNNYGLFCMSGNVAEMVYDNKTKVIKTKGGSWDSDFEECKITAVNDITAKTSPTNGFRPIFRISIMPDFGAYNRDDIKTGLTTLSPEEINTALKEKKKMIDAVVKTNKDKYAFIPMGSCVYKKDTISIQAFYMQTTEVTNLEYRTFLADLLIQNRPADYLIAKPAQEMWMNKLPWSFNEPMTNMYFWHPAYDEYPVVNISRKGAMLYCNWLTIETNKFLLENNKPLINDLRIPTDFEWACAAKEYKPTIIYANGGNSIKDNKGKYTVNYMCYSKEQCKYDSIMKLYVPKKPLNKDEQLLADFTADGGFHTVNTKMYNPNAYGLYCMAGNVAEMVNTYDKKNKTWIKKGTKGGSWFSCDYFLEVDAEDEYPNELEASPFIGFRPVFTAIKK